MSGEYVLAAVILPIMIILLVYCLCTLPRPRPPRPMIELTKHGDVWR